MKVNFLIFNSLLLILLNFGPAKDAWASPPYTSTPCTHNEPTNTCRLVNDCSQTNVQATIDASANGDGVYLPAGNCTWSYLQLTKGIQLIGSGIGSTVITGGGNYTIRIASVSLGDNPARISGLSIDHSANGLNAIQVDSDDGASPQGWRVDHVAFNGNRSTAIGGWGNSRGPVYGLVDHCTFFDGRVAFYGEPTSTGGRYRWSEPLDMGSEKAVYVEENTFTMSDAVNLNAIDGNLGFRYVFRFNTVTNSWFEAHSIQGDNIRAHRLAEIYGNTFAPGAGNAWMPGRIRGGTGVVFNNTVADGYTEYIFKLDNVRDCEVQTKWGWCDGTAQIDGNEGVSGWLCRDQPGASTDSSLWDFNVLPAPAQQRAPLYAWNNKHGSSEVPFGNYNGCRHELDNIQEDRDYFNYKQNCDGSSGLGIGTRIQMEAITTCVLDTGFWVTDEGIWNHSGAGGQGRLYKCTHANPAAWTLYYTPYPYPHPLQGMIDIIAPAAPSGLQVK